MGLMTSLVSNRATVQLANPRDPVLAKWFGGEAGEIHVDADSSLQSTAVWACIKVLSETIASLPFHLMRETSKVKKKATGHSLYKILHSQPNRYQTAYEYYELMVTHKALRGVAYAEKIYSNDGQISELIPLHPDYVTPFYAPNGSLAYYYQPAENRDGRVIFWDEMHVWKGLSFDGLNPISPITQHKRAIGLAIAADQYGERFFLNDATPGGVITMPGKFKDIEDKKRFINAWQQAQSGENRKKTAVLENDMKYSPIGMSNEDAQFLETKKYQKTDIASIYRIPPHMIGDLERATFSNIEHQGIEFVKYTLMPWLVSIEQSVKRDLFSENMVSYFLRINVDGLLRGDSASRATYYREQWNIGAITQNEIRELENRNAYDNGGDEPYIPLNMGIAGANQDDKKESNVQFERMLNANAERISRKECGAVAKLISKGVENFRDNVGDFYLSHIDYVAGSLGIDHDLAKNYCEHTKNELIDIVLSGDNIRLNEWENGRVEMIKEIVR